MEYETIGVEETQNEVVLDEECCEELQEENCPIQWDLEDQLHEEWRDNKDFPEEEHQWNPKNGNAAVVDLSGSNH